MTNPILRNLQICERFLKNPSGNLWKDILFSMLPQSPHPILSSPINNVSAAAMWSYLKLWKEAFRSQKAEKGHVIIIALKPSPAWVIVLLSAFWEDLNVYLYPPDEFEQIKNVECFGIISENTQISTWTVAENLEPQFQHSANPNSPKDLTNRVMFSKKYDQVNLTDHLLNRFLLNLKTNSMGESVLSTMDYSHPVGFLYDFFSSFFQFREMFFGHSLDETNILKLFDTYQIDHLICEHSLEDKFKLWKNLGKNNEPFKSISTPPILKTREKLFRLLDGDFTFSEKG